MWVDFALVDGGGRRDMVLQNAKWWGQGDCITQGGRAGEANKKKKTNRKNQCIADRVLEKDMKNNKKLYAHRVFI